MLLATLFLLLQGAPAKGTLTGHVFDSETGRPIGRALLTLRPQFNPNLFFTELTDAQGRFEFIAVDKGVYFLSCERAGYFKTSYGQKAQFDPQFTIEIPSEEGGALRLDLVKSGSISGIATDLDGGALDGTSVELLSREFIGGEVHFVRRGHAVVDDRGQYRLSGLAPGRYSVLLQGRSGGANWFARRTEWIAVRAGQEISGVDFHVPPAPSLTVAGEIRDANGGLLTGGSIVANELEFGGIALQAAILRDGTFRFEGLTPGRYRLQYSAFFRTFNFTTDTSGVVFRVAVRPNVRGRVVTSQPAAELSGRLLRLVPKEGVASTRNVTFPIRPDGTFEFANLVPGVYTICFASGPTGPMFEAGADPDLPFYIRGLRVGNKDSAKAEFEAYEDGSPPELELLLGNDSGMIQGHALDAKGAALRQARLVLMSAGSVVRTTVADRAGSFVMHGIAPGDYFLLLLSSDDAAAISATGEDAAKIPGAVPVTVKPGATMDLDVRLPDTR
jgi:hypothetical protein